MTRPKSRLSSARKPVKVQKIQSVSLPEGKQTLTDRPNLVTVNFVIYFHEIGQFVLFMLCISADVLFIDDNTSEQSSLSLPHNKTMHSVVVTFNGTLSK